MSTGPDAARPDAARPDAARPDAARPGPRVAVIGAGLMGAGIAQVFVTAGLPVAIYDTDPAALESVRSRVAEGLDLLHIPNENPLRLLTTAGVLAEAVLRADLVIEAAAERLAVKQAIFAELDRVAPPGAVLASNTSAIPIREITSGLRRRQRVIGTHFWNPPYLVPLVEVVQAAGSDVAVVDWAIALLDRIGMKPVHVAADVPGFVGNRLQHALKREAIALVANGACSAETVDTVTRFGFGRRLGIVGPLEQSDLTGLELTLAIHETLIPDLDRTAGPHPLLVEKVRRGETGAAAGRGFRDWAPGQAEARRAEISRDLADQARRAADQASRAPDQASRAADQASRAAEQASGAADQGRGAAGQPPRAAGQPPQSQPPQGRPPPGPTPVDSHYPFGSWPLGGPRT
jgi:3-hydroxybutyryl-CoA dehydrogenase